MINILKNNSKDILLKTAGDETGFTIIEATIAIFILLVGLLAVSEFFPLGLRIINDSQSQTTAANIALSKMEELRSSSYDEIGTDIIETKQRVSADPASYLYRYQRQTTVSLVDSDLNSTVSDIGLKKITVNVYWHSLIGSKEKSIEIYSLFSEY